MSGGENVIKKTSFNPVWEELYFCTEFEGGVRCLICLKRLNKVSKFNIRRHYLTFHAEEYEDLHQEKRIAEIARLKADPPVSLTKHQPYFNPLWEELFFFVGYGSQPTCLICLKTLNNNKKYNVQRHYSRYHEKQYGTLEKEVRLAELEKLRERYLTTTVNTQESEDDELLEIKEQISETNKDNKVEFQVENLSSLPFRCHPTWETYFFVEYKGSAKCLICLQTLTKPKQFNMKRHYYSLHEEEYSVFSMEERVSEIKSLKVKFIVAELNFDPSELHNVEEKIFGVLEKVNPKQKVIISELNHDVEEVLQVKEVIDKIQESDEVDLPIQTGNCFPSSLTCHPKWESYFFIEFNGMAKCLICLKNLAVRKKFNMQRHYSSLHEKEYSVFNQEERTCEINHLKANFIKTELSLGTSKLFNEENENVVNPNEKDKHRQKFSFKWEYMYFFVECNHMAKCLICLKTLSVIRKFNLERHYVTMHHKQYGMLSGIERRTTIEMLKKNVFRPTAEQEVIANSKNGGQLMDIKHEEDPLLDREETTLPIMKQEFCEESSCIIPDAHRNDDAPETKCFVNHLDHIDVKSEVESTHDVSDYMKSQLKYDEKNLNLQDDNRELQVGGDFSPENNCKYNYSLKPKITLHTNSLTGEFTYFCNTCNKSFSHSFSPNIHECIENEEPLYVCSICNISYVHKESILAHIEIHTQISNSFTEHMLTHARKKELKLKEHICQLCNKTFRDSNVYKRHLRFHSSNRPYTCNVCAKTFIESGDLKKHSEIHMGIRPYSCDMCSKSFRQKNDLIVHKRRHTGVRPYLCEFCGKTYYKQGDLVSHLRVHKGDRPYTCDVCNKAFHGKHGLAEHMIVHSDSRPYTCEICNKSFNRRDNMRTHKLLHQKDQPHVCVICNKGFSQLRTLKKHMLIH